VADALSRREYEPTTNKTMDELRQKETVYAMQAPIQKPRREPAVQHSRQYTHGVNTELICQIGKRMAYLLRHGACHERVHMDNQGYIDMTSLLTWLNKDLRHTLDVEDVTWIVDNNDKMRFSINTPRGVKANYGHSLELPEMIMTEYQEDVTGNNRYIVHETYLIYLPQIILHGLSRMERNHIHLCKQIGGTWIRRKKRTNIVIYIDVQAARRGGLKFHSAPNEVIMCSGDVNGYIPIKYFKEIKNIQTGEQIQFNKDIPGQEGENKCLSALAKRFTPSSRPTPDATTHTFTPAQPNNLTINDTTQYCGQAYNEVQARENINLEQREYNDSLPSGVKKINIVQDIPEIPQAQHQHSSKLVSSQILNIKNEDEEKFTFFRKKDSPFSQHYITKFIVAGVTYMSTEQYMMRQKAILFGDSKTADLLMNTDCPKTPKRLGRSIPEFDQFM